MTFKGEENKCRVWEKYAVSYYSNRDFSNQWNYPDTCISYYECLDFWNRAYLCNVPECKGIA
ncbi:MAG: hypothetical protein ACOCM4_05455 [Acetivibrio ethanolgignens]